MKTIRNDERNNVSLFIAMFIGITIPVLLVIYTLSPVNYGTEIECYQRGFDYTDEQNKKNLIRCYENEYKETLFGKEYTGNFKFVNETWVDV